VIDPELAARFAGRRVVVAGGLGFIGSTLAHELAAAGADLLLVDALIPEYGGSRANVAGLEGKVEIQIADVREHLPRIAEHADVIFNLAGQTSHLDSMRDPFTDLEVNCRAQLSILEELRAARSHARVVFAGTRQIYGRPRYLPVDEAHPIDPVDINGIHKLAAEWYHLLYGKVYGLGATVLRLTNTYGPRMRVKDARQTFLGLWFRQVLTGEQLAVWGDGTQRRDLTYVDDAVRALLLAGSEDKAVGEVFNLGDDLTVSLLELAQLVIDTNGRGSYRVVPFPEDRLAIDIGDYAGDYSKIKRQLGWRPTVSVEDGIARTLSFYRERGAEYWDET
jgi:UDP-glucose 4-epimerase